ncbi:MAG: hypothetical protein M3094_07055, partial [Actinomycetia bacterium]|nr:hypothetical protein [Actinomycetes bacterium]
MMRLGATSVLVMLAVGGLLAAACAPIGGDIGPQRTEPSDPASGPVIATAESGEATFVLHDEGEGCLAVDVQYPGLQRTVDRGCFDEWNTLRETPSCGWIEADPSAGGDSSDLTLGDCDVQLPRVIYGRVTDPAIGFVCVGRFDFEGGGSTGVVGARLLERDADGYIFEVADEGEMPPGHFLSRGGSRIGDPPLDAPSDPIYRFCEALAGVEQIEQVYGVDLLVGFDEPLRTDEVTVFFQAGLDQAGVNGSAFTGEEAMPIPMRVTPNVFDLEVQVETDTGPILTTHLDWPREFRDIVLSGVACLGLTQIGVHVGAGVLEGDDQAFDVTFIGSECTGTN